MAQVVLENIVKKFGSFTAVDDVSLTVNDKEMLVFVGPSGCGKTTTLRMIAGLEKQTSGNVYIGDTCVNQISPAKRDIAMVFQNYALYPHMTVYENIAFSLEARRMSKAEIERKVLETARVLGVDKLLKRKPDELSGGQKQRVALGRAMVRNPNVLLMDEPLSNLDAKLRTQMRSELKRLTREINTTTVYVTHDQVEAMTLGDRIAVMNEGRINQLDTPHMVYEYPANLFVAELIGNPGMNFFDAEIQSCNGQTCLAVAGKTVALPKELAATIARMDVGRKVKAGIRPERARVVKAGMQTDGTVIPMRILVMEPQGANTILDLEWEGGNFLVSADSDGMLREGDAVQVEFVRSGLRVFDPESGLLIR